MGFVMDSKDKLALLFEEFSLGKRNSVYLRGMLEKDASLAKAVDKDDNTLLLKASAMGDLDAVILLLEKGADVNATNKYGEYPYKAAMRHRHGTVATYLVSMGAKFDTRDSMGMTLSRTY